MERDTIIAVVISIGLGFYCGFVLGRHFAERETVVDDSATVEAWREGYLQGLEQSGLYRATWKGVERTGVVR